MSVLDDLQGIRLYRDRVAESEWLADNAVIPTVQRRYRTIARHYSQLAEREEQIEKAKMAERLTNLRRQREEAADQVATPTYLIATE